MHRAHKTTWFTLIILALLGACVADEGDSQIDVDFHTAALQQPDPAAAAEIGNDAIRLYQELTARLDERGVTLEEMQAAVDAGDAERVRELFDYTPEEFEAANERLQVIGGMANEVLEALADSGSESAEPEGLSCKGAFTCGLAAFAIATQWPNYVGLGFLVLASAGCALEYCEWDDGSGPRTKQP